MWIYGHGCKKKQPLHIIYYKLEKNNFSIRDKKTANGMLLN